MPLDSALILFSFCAFSFCAFSMDHGLVPT